MAYFASETIDNNLCVDYHSLTKLPHIQNTLNVGKILEVRNRRTHRSPTLQDIKS